MVEVIGCDEFTEWFQSLSDADTDAVARVVDMLETQGTALPFPYERMVPLSEQIWAQYLKEIGR